MVRSDRVTDRFAATAAVIGVVALATGWLVAVQRPVPDLERRIFEAVNDVPDAAADVLWPVMQLGVIGSVLVVAAVCAALWRRAHPAVDVLFSGLLAWCVTPVLKAIVERGRPAVHLNEVIVREAHADGVGFPSNHTAVAFAIATALAPSLPVAGRVGVYVVAGLVGVARVVHGVHLPADVLGGVGVGLLCGVTIRLVFDRLGPPTEVEDEDEDEDEREREQAPGGAIGGE